MRNSTIEFKGIVRATSGQVAGEGACEELINTRFESGHLRVVGKKKIFIADTNYKQFLEHKTGPSIQYIAIIENYVCTLETIYNGTERIFTGAYTAIYGATGEVELSVLNNLLIISDVVAKKLVVYEYKNGEYALLYNDIPALPAITITKESYLNPNGRNEVVSMQFSSETGTYNLDQKLFKDALIGALKDCKARLDEYDEGYFLISVNYTLITGMETKMSNPIIVSIGNPNATPFRDVATYVPTSGPSAQVVAFLDLQKAKVVISNAPEFETYKYLIKSINIYATLPQSHYNLDVEAIPDMDIDPEYTGKAEVVYKYWNLTMPYKDYGAKDMGDLLFFKQHEIAFGAIDSAGYYLKFGNDQATNKTMVVDNSGWLRTFGKMFIYNSRLHLFDYTRTLLPEAGIYNNMANTLDLSSIGAVQQVVSVAITLKDQSEMIAIGEITARVKYNGNGTANVWLAQALTFPDSRAYRAEIWWTNEGVVYKGAMVLLSSTAYNYSIFLKLTDLTTPSLVCSTAASAPEHGETLELHFSDTILVSSQGAPYHFPVEHSYRIGGEIQDLALMVEQLSEAQQGQYPVIVLTDRGVFALQQGQGIVLYSNLIPISNDVCRRGAVQTKSGVAYIANNSVNILYGRRGVSISQVIESYLDRSIRFNNSFAQATGNIELYNITEYLSQVDFREYIKEAELFYDSVREEIIVSNLNYLYSYAFSLREKLWHKITEVFKGNTGRYALRPSQAQQQPALSATGSITIPALVIRDSFSFASQNKCTITGGDTLIPSGQQLSFLVGTTRLSSYYTQATMPLYMCLEVMLGVIPFIEISYNSVSKVITIYSSKSEYTGQTITYRNITSDTTITQTLAAFSNSITIEKKGIGEVIPVIVGATTINLTILESDSYLSIIQRLCAAILAANSSVTITTDLNKLYITTKATGTAQNSTVLTTTSSLYVIVSDVNFSGGRDAGLANTEDSAVDVVDLNDEEIEGTNIIHIQTRPAQLGTIGYKTILRAALRGLIKPSGRPFGAYLFASNDLSNWNYVSGAQIAQNIANLRLLRAKASYRYFILVAGGNVDINNDLVMLEMDIEDKFEDKTR